MVTGQREGFIQNGSAVAGGPIMVHGTSVESAIELLSTGRILPSSALRPMGHFSHPVNRGYLFFVPRKKSFAGHPLHDAIDLDLDGEALDNEVRSYAQNLQGIEFLRSNFGNWPAECNYDEFEPYGNWSLEMLDKKGVNVGLMRRYGLHKIYAELQKRAGVCIGINDRMFELKIEDGHDSPGEEVMVHLPDGLELKYVLYIRPFGEIERKALDEYLLP